LIAIVVVVDPDWFGSTFGMLFRKTRIGTEPPVGAVEGTVRLICQTPTSVGARPEYVMVDGSTNAVADAPSRI
jgi:hypothetical protein